MEINIKVIQLLGQQGGVSRSGKEWTRAQFIGETIEQYSKKICFTIFNPNDNKKVPAVGDNVTVSFDIDSKSWVDRSGVERWETSIMVWKITPTAQAAQQSPDELARQYQNNPAPQRTAPQPAYQQAPPQPSYQQPATQPVYPSDPVPGTYPQAAQPQYNVPQGSQPVMPTPQGSDDLPF